MKKKLSILFSIPFLILFLACETEPPSVDSILFFDNVSFDPVDETLDFGTNLAGGSGSSISGTVRNQSGATITLQSLTLSDSQNYSLSEIDLPKELPPESILDFELSFSPVSSGTKTAELSVTYIIDTEETLTVNLTGEGNEAPSAAFGLEVSGASAYPEINGFYERDGNYNSASRYKMTGGTDYFIYFYMSDGQFWGINDTLNDDYPYYSGGVRYGARAVIQVSDNGHYIYPPEFNLNDSEDWHENFSTPNQITFATGITRENDTLKANHKFIDTEGDKESGTKYRWFISSSADGTFTVVSGETASEISVTDHQGSFFKLEVTPADENGFEGSAVTSDPYYVEPVIAMQ